MGHTQLLDHSLLAGARCREGGAHHKEPNDPHTWVTEGALSAVRAPCESWDLKGATNCQPPNCPHKGNDILWEEYPDWVDAWQTWSEKS